MTVLVQYIAQPLGWSMVPSVAALDWQYPAQPDRRVPKHVKYALFVEVEDRTSGTRKSRRQCTSVDSGGGSNGYDV